MQQMDIYQISPFLSPYAHNHIFTYVLDVFLWHLTSSCNTMDMDIFSTSLCLSQVLPRKNSVYILLLVA
ncbi:hypothetical protein GDO81_009795 [Engystomops pustulosus]|uniref:Uncharacterized protein n=1 Tax=Engystomops pustulosus TaxID=76066 RepID=A0AAV7BUW2_ENGPU|nr:hypothetical protein GDO81_009795 [Engystomops pustulosus]